MSRPPVDPRLDDPLAGELERALAVEHSAAFRARVRARVAREPVRRASPLRWTLAAAGSAALAAGLAGLLWFTPDPDPAVVPPPERARAQSTVAPGVSESRPADVPETSSVARSERATSPPVVAAAAVDSPPPPRVPASVPASWDSLVVISAGEAAALRRLFREASAGVVELHVQSGAGELTAPPPELETPPLTVDSIAIEPIAVQPLPSIEELGV